MADLAAFARTHDPDRFLCALFAPAARRDALFALIAYNHELARAREAASNLIAARMRLLWWREAVEEATRGAPPRRHEVAAPLHAAIAAGLLDPAALLAMAEAREIESEEDGIATETAFVAYLRGTAGGWSHAAALALGATAAEAEAQRGLGAAYGLAGVLRSVPAHATHGRCLLPRDRLAREGMSAEALIAEPAGAGVRRFLAGLADEGRTALAGASRHVPREAIAAALPAVLAARDLERIARGAAVRAPRALGDRVAVLWHGLRGRL
jgi:phytoene synthase